MSKTSKTARASMVTGPVGKTVISDETYIKNLRNDVNSGLYVAQEGAKALLRAYDAALETIEQLNEQNNGLSTQVNDFAKSYETNVARIAELEAEIAKIKAVINA